MTDHDDELEDFLRRRKPLFRAAEDDVLEPPAELDRIVLRQAREAIESARPQRMFRAPRWGAPVALAATLVLAFTIILRVGLTEHKAAAPGVTVQKAARQLEPRPLAEQAESAPAAAAPAADSNYPAGAPAGEDSVVVDLGVGRHELARDLPEQRARAAISPAPPPPAAAPLVAEAEARRYAEPPPAGPQVAAAPPASNRSLADSGLVSLHAAGGESTANDAAGPTAKAAAETQPWRRDAKAWLAEIDRLRAAGDVARADAEMAEFKRQHRAYAGAPDR